MVPCMAETEIDGAIQPPYRDGPVLPVRFLVDGGATYTVLPLRLWAPLGLQQDRTIEICLADGTTIARAVSECRITIPPHRPATSPVILGDDGEGPLLGSVTLASVGLML